VNVIEELQSLDMNEPGRWPLPFRVAAVVLVFIAITAVGSYMFVIKSDIPLLKRAQNEEQELRATFEQKQRKAANFDAYRAQLAEIERNFGTMLRQLPGKTEVPSLLVDISQTAVAAGLQEELF
jgi:type IV pilus assembly protein PilO